MLDRYVIAALPSRGEESPGSVGQDSC